MGYHDCRKHSFCFLFQLSDRISLREIEYGCLIETLAQGFGWAFFLSIKENKLIDILICSLSVAKQKITDMARRLKATFLTHSNAHNKNLIYSCHSLLLNWFAVVTRSVGWRKAVMSRAANGTWVITYIPSPQHDKKKKNPTKQKIPNLRMLLYVDFSFLRSYLFDQVWIRILFI